MKTEFYFFQVDVCIGIHFFVGEFLVTALQSEKRFCLETRRRTAYSGCPKFFSSCIKSSGIIDGLSLKNNSSWIILSA